VPLKHNHIFSTVGSSENADIKQDKGIVSNNIFINNANELPYESIAGNINDYINSGKILGLTTATSAAIDGGRNDLDYPDKDIWGKTRVNLPDIGAVELK